MTAKRIAYLLIAVAVFGGFFWAFQPQPVPVDVAEIDRGDVAVTVTDEGVARIREVFTVYAPTPGRMRRTPREIGDLVVRNRTIVAIIEPQAPVFLDMRARREAQAAVRAARAAVKLAEAELVRAEAEEEFWRTELERNENLRASRTIAAKTLDQARLEHAIRIAAIATAEAGIEKSRRELELAEATLIQPAEVGDAARSDCCVTVRSPVSGRVLELMVESAHVVTTGEPILSIGDPADLEIVVDYLSADAVGIERGAKARITRWGGAAPLEAEVARVEPAGFTEVSALGIEEQRVNVVLDIRSPPEAMRGLGHGYRVLAEVEIERRSDVVRAPLGALFREGEGWAVFVVTEGKATLRPVEIGVRDQQNAEVLLGLADGDVVALYPSDLMADGVEVELR